MANPKKIDISRDYLPIDFVARRVGCEVDDLVYLAGKDCLDVFVLAAGWLADAFILNCDIWGIASPHEGVLVTGPVQLYSEDMQRFEADPSAAFNRLKGNTAGRDLNEPDEVWEFRLREGVRFADCKLVVMTAQLTRLGETAPSEEKPLGTREKNSLLKIVATLAIERGYDLHHASAAADALKASMAKTVENPIELKAIANHLEAALAVVNKQKK